MVAIIKELYIKETLWEIVSSLSLSHQRELHFIHLYP